MQFKSSQPPGAVYVCVCVSIYVCVFVIPLNGFFLDLMEQVPSQGNGLHRTHKVKRSETGEKLRTLVQSICERYMKCKVGSCVSIFFFPVHVRTHLCFCVAMITPLLMAESPLLHYPIHFPFSCFSSQDKSHSRFESARPRRRLSTVGTMISVQYVTGSSPADNQAGTGLHNRFGVSLQPR